jgi:hypothetical protein
MRVPREYDGLWSLTWRRVRGTAQQAGVVWLVVIAVVALPWVEPWHDGGSAGVRRWAAAVLVPAAAVLVGSLAFHWAGEAIRRWRVRPTAVWNEGRWWLTIRPRGRQGGVTIRCKVIDEDGATATHEFTQEANEPIVDMFPDTFDVAGMKAGRKQPWGRYDVTWAVYQRGHRPLRATVAFEWHIFTQPG